jgi:LysM repeat protein
MADARFEQLKAKYQTVLKKLEQLGVRLENLHVQDNKLVIRGHAKSQHDSNELWNQIKLVDANYQADLMAEFSYDQQAAAAPKPQPQAAPSEPRTYTVRKGDTLSRIAQALYGDSSLYRKIFDANRETLSDPDKIQPGQVLVVPA